MGRRARVKGVTNAALKAGYRALNEKDGRAHDIAQAVYTEVLNWRAEEGPDLYAPVAVSAAMAAPLVADRLGLPPGTAPDVAAWLTYSFLHATVTSSLEDFEAWRAEMHPAPASIAAPAA